MIKVDKRLLELSDVVTYMSVAMTLSTLASFTQSKKNLEAYKDYFIANAFEFGQHVEEVDAITEQLEYLNKNIKTLENAILYHEAKCIEKRIGLGKLQSVGLN